MSDSHLTLKSRHILRMLADGASFAEIQDAGIASDDGEIADAVGEALEALGEPWCIPPPSQGTSDPETNGRNGRLEAARKKWPRQGKPWTEEEEVRLLDLMQSTRSITAAAEALQRSSWAIHVRLEKLGYRVLLEQSEDARR